jgi:dienelactone hydrolase
MRSLTRLFRDACSGAALVVAALVVAPAARADCPDGVAASTRFIQFPSPNLATNPPSLLTIKGKLSYPGAVDGRQRCLGLSKRPAVLILHGSSGVDARGDFYQQALNAAGFITLQIDMWEARGVTGLVNRPSAPILTYPDAFSALAFLASLPEVDADRVGVLGFSWGGVVSLAAAERLYTELFGGGRRFAAHVANYPVCYGANNTTIPALQPPAAKGTQFLNLTGAPVLVQIGSNDDYDNGTARCKALAAAVNPGNNGVVQVLEYPGAYHAWDRLMVPVTAGDIFANEGSYFATGVVPQVRIVPDVDQAFQARQRVVQFFRQSL